MSPGMWHRTMVYLGLKDEPEEGYDELPERYVQEEEPRRRSTLRQEPLRRPTPLEVDEPARPSREFQTSGDVHVIRPGVTPASASTGPTRTPVIEILVFDDVEAVGARYRTGQPVLFDASKADATTGRRVVDFVSGMTYVSRGTLTRVGDRAFLLVPEGIELSDEETERLTDLGYDVRGAR